MNTLLMKVPMFCRWFAPKEDSRNAARDRLKTALVGDRQTVAPQLMSCLQKDIEECMSRYLRADKAAGVYKMIEKNGKMTLSVEVPVLHILRQGSLPEEALKEEATDQSHGVTTASCELKLVGRRLRKGRSKRFNSSEPES